MPALCAAVLLMSAVLPARAATSGKSSSAQASIGGEKEFSELALIFWRHQRDIEQMISDLRLKARDLPELRREYGRVQDLQTLQRLRAERGGPFLKGMAALWPAVDRFHDAKRGFDQMSAMMSMTVMMHGRSLPAGPAYEVSYSVDRAKRDIDRSVEELKAALADEDAAFREACERLRDRRRKRLLLGGCAAAGLGLGLAAWAWRRSAAAR